MAKYNYAFNLLEEKLSQDRNLLQEFYDDPGAVLAAHGLQVDAAMLEKLQYLVKEAIKPPEDVPGATAKRASGEAKEHGFSIGISKDNFS